MNSKYPRYVALATMLVAGVLTSLPVVSGLQTSPSITYPGPWSTIRPTPVVTVAEERTTHPIPTAVPETRPPVPVPIVVAKTEPRPTPAQTRQSSTSVAATATWYCLPGVSACTRGYSGGLYAAISPDLGYLRGRSITVCYASHCIPIKVIDCNCQATRGIDLYADAFRLLAPLSAGRIHVTISY